MEILPHLAERQRAGRRHEAEIHYPYRHRAGRLDLVRVLEEHAQAEPLEYRQRVGERHALAAAPVDLEAQHARLFGIRGAQVHAEVALRVERFDLRDIGERLAGAEFLAVARREGVLVRAPQLVRALLAMALDERGIEIVFPAAHRLHETRLECLQVGARRHLAGLGADAHQDAPEHRGGKIDVEFGGSAVERFGEDALEALAQLRGVALARHIDEAGDEARVRVLAHQQPQPLALAKLQDRHRVAVEVLRADLQQLVARIALEDRGERLAAVARRQQSGAGDDVGEFAPQERHLHRVLRIRGVRVQAEEARLADHLARRVEMLDADIVEVAGSVHRGARIRLREHQQLLHPGALARFGR